MQSQDKSVSKARPVTEYLILIYMPARGRFKVVLSWRRSEWVRRRIKSLYTFVRDKHRIQVVSVFKECDRERAAAIANSYLIDPKTTLDAIDFE